MIHKSQPSRAAGFDERPWPVLIALLALAALAAALIVAFSPVDDPRPLHNSWVRMELLAAVAVLLAAASVPLGRAVPYRLQLALVVSLFCHVLLAVILRGQLLPMSAAARGPVARRPAPQAEASVQPIPVEPREPADRWEELQAAHRVRSPEVQTVELTREQTSPQTARAVTQVIHLPETDPPTELSSFELRRPEMALPHQAPELSALSKHSERARAIEPGPAAAVRVDPGAGQPASPVLMAAASIPARRRLPELARRQAVLPLPRTEPAPPTAQPRPQPADQVTSAPIPRPPARAGVAGRAVETTAGPVQPGVVAPQLGAANPPPQSPVVRKSLQAGPRAQHLPPRAPAPLDLSRSAPKPVPTAARQRKLPRTAAAPAGRASGGGQQLPEIDLVRTAVPRQPAEPPQAGAAARLSAALQPTRSRAARPAASTTSMVSRTGQRLPVRAEAPPGLGGLGPRIAPEAGLPEPTARRDSVVVHTVDGHYLRRKVGAPAAVGARARDAADAFTRRGRRQRERISGGEGAPTPQTEQAIERGLAYLARLQRADGRWTLAAGQTAGQPARFAIQADVAATGLALLAFLGAGYDHYDDKYQAAVQRGLEFLRASQQQDGGLYLPRDRQPGSVTMLYGHGIASIALSEALGMTGDPELRDPAQRAIDFIVRSQHKRYGGWRYRPGISADLSVSGWHVMALKSGQLAGLNVPQETFAKTVAFLDRCRGTGPNRAYYVYNPKAADTAARRHGLQVGTVMTSVGLLMRLYTGHDRTEPTVQRGADLLLKNLPRPAAPPSFAALRNPMRDTYYWYYATQVMFHMKGRYWKAWHEHLHPLLAQTQIAAGPLAGSWDPRRPAPDRWGRQAGRMYVTTMNLLSLEVAYRHLPLYATTAR